MDKTGIAWATRMTPEQVRSLQSVSVALHVRTQRSSVFTWVTLTVSPSSGLGIRFRRTLQTESQRTLDAYVNKIENIRKAMNLRGEAIILALTMDDDMWAYGKLKFV